MRSVLLALLLTAPVAAQTVETYTIPADAARVVRADELRLFANVQACESRGLVANCTQAQADAVRPGGTIYADSQAGRQSAVRAFLASYAAGERSAIRAAVRRYRLAASGGVDALCTTLGESAGRDPFAGN